MFKIGIYFVAALIILIGAGCSEPEFENEQTEGQVEEFSQDRAQGQANAQAEVDISDEALIDIIAHDSYLSMSLQEEYSDDPAAMNEEYEKRMEEVVNEHGMSLEEIDLRDYEEYIMQNPDLLREIQQRAAELQAQEE
ncbi:MAG: hypothetical protein ACQESB_06545 [Elusimicrobiota bacterium]